jgi:DNA-directed RNA polymerase beta subunit
MMTSKENLQSERMVMTNDLSWDIIQKYFDDNVLVKHQLESYNDFVLRKIDEIIEGFNPIEIHHQYMPEHDKFKFLMSVFMSNPVLSRPMIYEKDGSTKIMTPNDARLRNFSYSAALNVDIEINTSSWDEEQQEYIVENKKLNNINLGKIPVMVNSRYCVNHNNYDMKNINHCRYDAGGYFIINGNEKVIISQDRICENKTHVFVNNKQTAYSLVAEIRSVAENKFGVPKTTSLKLSAKSSQYGRYIRVNIHHIKQDVPLFILFKALGIENDKEIVEYIVYNTEKEQNQSIMNELIGTIDEASGITCARDALEYLSKYLQINGYPKEILNNKPHRLNILRSILEKEFLPHVGTDFRKKALYLGHMTNKLLGCHIGIYEMDDRDSYINKRVDTPGVLLANLFRQYFGKMVKDMRNMIQKELNTGSWKAMGKFNNLINKVNVYKIIKSTVIESGLKYALATGNWGIKNNKNKQGVAQVLNRMTYNSTLSHLRRINTPIEKTGKLVQPRKLHSTQWGYICSSETPEGSAIGLVKNMSVAANITIASNTTTVREILNEQDSRVKFFENGNINIFDEAVKVIVNGDIIGVCQDPFTLYNKLKQAKKSGAINVCTGVVWNIHRNEIHINTEGGRCVRPLFVVDEKQNRLKFWDYLADLQGEHKHFTWTDLVLNGVIEFIDVEETNFMMIAVKEKELTRGDKGTHKQPRYTHMEIHPSLILGVLAGSIPFSDHNQAPRNTYQCLDPNETVLMEDGRKVALKNIRIGDRVVTFDPKTKLPKISKVVFQYVRPTNKNIYEITTVSGRKIIATENHPFMTNEGWKRVEDFGANTKIGIYMNPEPVSTKVPNDYLILHKYTFANKLENQWGMDYTMAEAYEKELNRMGMFPLNISNRKMPIWARIIGKIYSSAVMNMLGTMDIHIEFPSREDAIVFDNDVSSLGFEIKGKYEMLTDGSVKLSYRESAFVGMVMALCDKFQIPSWIELGSIMMQREFLAGFLGGNGKGPSVEFINQLVKLGEQFGVLELNDKTIEHYFDTIGWRYNIKKTVEIGGIMEYVKARRRTCHDNSMVSDLDTWQRTIVTDGYGLFVPIASIKEVHNRDIADITVEDENHSFIAGSNFMSSNSAMAKQAIGVYASNFRHRFDTMAHVLNYPQKPIVQTNISKLIYANEMPRGINAMVAIMTYTGFNQEDSVILNKSAIDRGLFTSTFYRTYKEQCNKNHSNGEEEFFIKPNPQSTKGIKPFNYDKLNEDGFVPENTFVDSGDIIVGKCMPQKIESVIVHKDTSISLKNNESGFIDKNCYGEKYFTAVNGDGYNFTKVRIRNTRVPTIGDKFSSYSAQKGTLGMYYGQEEMPFTKDGIVPDIIMNPHAIPSRMTISQLMECLMGKACTLKGSYGDATPFTDLTVEDVADELQAQGMERYGNEILYDPRTGEQIHTLVFIGPTFYQRLKHMTADKQHSRAANGPIVQLTRQPAEGRAREGGLRIGEMEVECNLAHGISSFLKERLVEMSDNYRIFTCKKCGLIANCNPEQDLWLCKSCKNTTHFAEFRIPYAAKLLMQELATMSIGMRFMAAS